MKITKEMLKTFSYEKAGVSLETGSAIVQGFKSAVQDTHGPEVVGGIGGFGGMFSARGLKDMVAPVLVASTDGVGTKTKLGTQLGRFEGLGYDIVNHCINDILVQGAKPLFFMDYVASSRLQPDQIISVVTGCAKACKEAGCALLGGETAEMPGVYVPGEIDIVGTIVGAVERANVVDGQNIELGDAIIALRSDGLHTNGFSLARQIIAGMDLESHVEELGESIADALLRPHRSYLPEVSALWDAGVTIRGMAHITGGGVVENLPRILPEYARAQILYDTWDPPPVFAWLKRAGRVEEAEMFRAFNMGLGMILVVPSNAIDATLKTLSSSNFADATMVGRIIIGPSANSLWEGPRVELVSLPT
jgi:phosphoribosylformylglycinamidine cyclo-ligase